ncbi:hypothetical protein V8C26DRAFT_394278, partial [Trichoderma gracile]
MASSSSSCRGVVFHFFVLTLPLLWSRGNSCQCRANSANGEDFVSDQPESFLDPVMMRLKKHECSVSAQPHV